MMTEMLDAFTKQAYLAHAAIAHARHKVESDIELFGIECRPLRIHCNLVGVYGPPGSFDLPLLSGKSHSERMLASRTGLPIPSDSEEENKRLPGRGKAMQLTAPMHLSRTREEALANVREGIELCLKLVKDGKILGPSAEELEISLWEKGRVWPRRSQYAINV